MRPDDDPVRGLAQLEGHLLWNAELTDARVRADRFTEALPWLTTAQREDVERVYVADRVAASRATLIRIRARAVELRGEYEERYRRLRARCVMGAVLAVGAASGTCTALNCLTR
ncbi:hypothetical protein [Streptomyces sp. DT171]|uniref:hypothetical protein n=1 Tax=Streptomyces sp. DT171 TaxID=3416524 RepID=UPI003CF15B32